MKLIDHFGSFLEDTVNLNQTRLATLEARVEAIQDVLRSSDWSPKHRSFVRQGSWVHKTIIKPIEGGTFDADLLVIVDPVDRWDAKEYVNTLKAVFSDHGTYADKVKAWDVCVTLTYAGDLKLDLAPCVRNRVGQGFEICNRITNQFQPSSPEDYTQWLLDRNSWAGTNALRKVTRLLKYLRDIKATFTCPSMLLTTLLGDQVGAGDQSRTEEFADVPTSLRTLVGRMDDWLQMRSTRPRVPNPVLPSEDLGRMWAGDEQYQNFRDKLHTYRTWIDDAFDETDRDESVGKWRRVFGDEFAKGLDLEAAVLQKAAVDSLSATGSVTSGRDDMVALLERFGARAIPERITRLPYMRRPRWRRQGGRNLVDVRVKLSLHQSKGGPSLGNVGDLSPLPKGQWLRACVFDRSGLPLATDFKVFWRVTNTDAEAAAANQLRGDFYEPDTGNCRWETLEYRGLHMIEAFVVRRRDEVLVAQSLPAFVVIQ